MFAPMLVIARSTLACAPSPIATTQMTAPTPMMMPSIVKAVRSMFRRNAFTANHGIIRRFIDHRATTEKSATASRDRPWSTGHFAHLFRAVAEIIEQGDAVGFGPDA